jgi:hypothetical protein
MMALYSISIYTRPTVSSKVSDRKRLDGYQNGKSQRGGQSADKCSQYGRLKHTAIGR